MDLGLLDYICDGYCSYLRTGEDTPEIDEFKEKYIYPLLKQDPKAGLEMEAKFNSSLFECDTNSFKNGFRICIFFLIECLQGNL